MNIPTHRLHNQRLGRVRLETPEAVVRWLGAVQAQDFAGALWGVAQRTASADAEAVGRAFDSGAFIRTHVMRPTWHFVPAEELRWLLALTAERVRAKLKTYDRPLEIDAAVLGRSHDLLAGALAGGRHRTRQELAAVLGEGGVEARGQRLNHLVMHAEIDGVICSGPRRGKQQTYALLDERVPAAAPRSREKMLAELARRYFASHGPATPHDFAWWSGLTVSDARAALALLGPDAEATTVDGTTYWTASTDAPAPVEAPAVHLLPNFDEHVVAYRDHDPSCHPAARGKLQVRGGLDAHLVTLDGLVVGGWRRTIRKAAVQVTLTLLTPLEAPEHEALGRAAEAYGRFLGLPVTLAEN